jgi:hypothetical protein
MLFDFQEAERRLAEGSPSIRRRAWASGAYLALYVNPATSRVEVQLFDSYYGAFWDLNGEDKAAEDWYDAG